MLSNTKRVKNTEGSLYLVGSLCIRNHKYKNQDVSLRYKKGDHQCVLCSRERSQRNNHHELNAYKRKISSLKLKSKKLGLDFDLDQEWFLNNKSILCPVLGIPLVYNSSSKCLENLASVDRIVPTKGYTKSNCRIISHRANYLKGNASLEEFEKVYTDLVNINKHLIYD